MAGLYARWQKKNIDNAPKTRRVLLLSGAWQCGKTTLAKQLATQKTDYRTLDDLALRHPRAKESASFTTAIDQQEAAHGDSISSASGEAGSHVLHRMLTSQLNIFAHLLCSTGCEDPCRAGHPDADGMGTKSGQGDEARFEKPLLRCIALLNGLCGVLQNGGL